MKMQKVWKTGLVLAALTLGASSARAQMMDVKAMNAEMLVRTLSEEKTEIAHLASQQAMFRKMNDMESTKIARMLGMWIRMHKAGAPMLEKLIRANGGDPMDAKVLKPAVLGDKTKMLHATEMEHMAAVETSQIRYGKTNSAAIKMTMHKRANLARTHLKQLKPYHNDKNCPMCASMMKGGKSEGTDMKMDGMDKGDMGGGMDNMNDDI